MKTTFRNWINPEPVCRTCGYTKIASRKYAEMQEKPDICTTCNLAVPELGNDIPFMWVPNRMF